MNNKILQIIMMYTYIQTVRYYYFNIGIIIMYVWHLILQDTKNISYTIIAHVEQLMRS